MAHGTSTLHPLNDKSMAIAIGSAFVTLLLPSVQREARDVQMEEIMHKRHGKRSMLIASSASSFQSKLAPIRLEVERGPTPPRYSKALP